MKSRVPILFAAFTALAPGCACRSAPPPPPTVAQAAPSSPPASASVEIPIPGAPFDPAIARPLLADPRLAAVAAALEAGDAAAAAQAAEQALTGAGPDRARWLYLIGRLHTQAKHPREAAAAFEAAALPAWELSPYALCAAAEAARQAGDLDRAVALASRAEGDAPVASACNLTRADALEAKGDVAAALPLWRHHVADGAHPPRWAEVALKAARALVATDPGEALTLARRVAIEQPTGALAAAASEIERAAVAALPEPERAARRSRTHDDEATRAQALFDGGRVDEAEDAASALDGALSPDEQRGGVGCRVATVLARAHARKKQRAAAADAWGSAIERCTAEAHVTALWQGGQASSSAGRPAEAITRFDRLEREHPHHRLADDARVKGAIASLLLGDEARFVARLERIGEDYPDGDLSGDGLFRLAARFIEKGDWAASTPPLEAALKLRPREREYWAAGRARYFYARALLATGQRARAIEELTRVLRDHPLTYYMALAHARLAELEPALADAALTAVAKGDEDARPMPPDHPSFHTAGFARAVELLRQGDTDAARGEISALGIGGPGAPDGVLWALAELYGASGAVTAAHAIPRGRLVDWLDHWPTGRWRAAWELAYPRPFLPVVTREAKRSQIPVSLAYAVMREESSFDAGVVSSAQAYGLMQLIVPTAKHLGKKLGVAVSEAELKKPAINVALGCRYLADLRAAFPECPALAIPSYNAGPGAPRRWLAQRPYDDLDVFVERIPFEETRNYTKRVLKSYLAYLWLYEPDRLSEALRMPKKPRRGDATVDAAKVDPSTRDDEVAP